MILSEEFIKKLADVPDGKLVRIPFKLLHPDAKAPTRAHEGDAGWDLCACTKDTETQPGTVRYGTGVAVAIPDGYVGLVFPRSSIRDTNLSLTNSVGVIDSGYRGEIGAAFDYQNRATHRPSYAIGDRICQLVILPLPAVEFALVDELPPSQRGAGGFGSSGK